MALAVCFLTGCEGGARPAKERPAAAVFYVSPSGNDSWTGAEKRPFGTLEAAVLASRAVRQTNAAAVIRIVLREGTHWLSKPLVLTPEDSRLELVAYRGEKPVVSGGRLISGWKLAQTGGHQVWVAELPEVRDGRWMFRQLWVNGKRAVRARHPDTGYLEVAELPDKTSEWTVGHTRFQFAEGDLRNVPGITNAEVIVMNRWAESRLPITSIDEKARLAAFGMKSVFQLAADDPYYVEGAIAHLNSPGEWCLDPAAGGVFYFPAKGEQITSVVAIAPVLSDLLRFEGRPAAGQFIDEIRLAGLTFSHTEWQHGKSTGGMSGWPGPAGGVGGFPQAAIGVSGAVRGAGVRGSLIQDCTFARLGGYALELGEGCSANKITHCVFTDLGAGGVKLGETEIRKEPQRIASSNEVSDCHIFDGGKFFHSAIGIWIGQSPGNRLLRNHIHDFYYTGISLGWTWGYGEALATNTLVALNHVHHIGKKSDGEGPILSDMAGVYTLGRHTGTVIANNLWHDVAGLRYGGWGIYFDEGTSHITAVSNVVLRTTHGGFHQHYGMSNGVYNNIFAFARDFQVQRTRPEAHLSFRFMTNIVYFDTGTLLGGNWSGTNYVMDWNVYFDARPEKQGAGWNVGHQPLEEWRAQGNDRNTVVGDPKLWMGASNRVVVLEGSPAFGLGFRRIE